MIHLAQARVDSAAALKVDSVIHSKISSTSFLGAANAAPEAVMPEVGLPEPGAEKIFDMIWS